MIPLTLQELALIRKWFAVADDLKPGLLTPEDLALNGKIQAALWPLHKSPLNCALRVIFMTASLRAFDRPIWGLEDLEILAKID